jgi:hypothetical protein
MASYSTQEAALARAVLLAQKREAPMFVVYDGEEEGFAVASEEDLDTFYLGASVLVEVLSDGTCIGSVG